MRRETAGSVKREMAGMKSEMTNDRGCLHPWLLTMQNFLMNKLIPSILLLLPLAVFAQSNTTAINDIFKACYKAITLAKEPDFLAADSGTAWVVDNNNNRIQKISVNGNNPQIIDTITGACAAPVIAYNAVWVVSCAEKQLYKIDKNTGKIIAKIPTGVADNDGEMALAAGDGSIWMLTDSRGILSRINATTNTVIAKINVEPHSYCAAFGHNAVWVSNYDNNSVQKIDAKTNTVTATIPVGLKPRFITVGEGGVWTLNQGDGTVTRVGPETNKAVATIDVMAKGSGGDITAGGGRVWIVSTNINRPLQTINPATNVVDNIYLQTANAGRKIKVDGAARASGSYVWVSNLYSQTVWAIKR